MKIYLHLQSSEYTRQLHLDGANILPPISGTFYQPGVGTCGSWQDQPTITETLEVRLEGTRVQIHEALDTLSEFLGSVENPSIAPQNRLFLRVEYEDTGTTWQSRIFSGAVSGNHAGLAAKESGADLLTLTLCRLHYWEATAGEVLKLTNRSGTKQASLTILNHHDATAGHDNTVDIAAEDIPGDLPTPLELTLLHNTAGRSINQLWLAQVQTCAQLPTWKPVYELELAFPAAGVTLTSISDPASSAGFLGRLAFNAGAEARLLDITLSAAHISFFQGRLVKPWLRLAAPHAYPDLWLKVKVTWGAARTIAWDTGWVLSAAGQPCVEFESIPLPPYPATYNYHDTLYLSLYAYKPTPAAVTLDMDDLHLLPTQGFNRLDLLDPLPAGYNLQEGAASGSYRWSSTTLYALPSHARAGEPLHITPGQNCRLHILHRAAASAPTDTPLIVSASIFKRRKHL